MRSAGFRTTPPRGFALLAVLVAVVILLVVSVTAASSIAAFADNQRVDLTSKVLMQLTDSSGVGVAGFWADIGDYPGRLTQLRNPLVSGARDVCGTNFNTGERNDWIAPYFFREATASGMWVGIGMARDSVAKDPISGTPNSTTPHALVVLIDNVDPRDARLLNIRHDPEGEASPGSEGRVRWGTPNAEGRVVMQWRKTITEC